MSYTPLPFLGRRHLTQTHTPTRLRIDIRKVQRRPELLALPCLLHDAVEFVNLFEGETLGLVDHEIDEGDADKAEGAPDEEDFGLKIGVLGVYHVGGAVCYGLRAYIISICPLLSVVLGVPGVREI